jgi:RNA polymerase sigma factor (sigma-70 family)
MSRRLPEKDMAEAGALALEVSRFLFAQAYRITGDWAESEDLVQEAITAALDIWDRFSGWPRTVQVSWLSRVVVNKKIDWWRTGHRRNYPLAEVPDIRVSVSTETVALNCSVLDRVDEVIKQMPPERKKVAFLRWYCCWTIKEIAEWNGVTPSTVRGHVMWALRELNEKVRPELPFIDDITDDGDEGVCDWKEAR